MAAPEVLETDYRSENSVFPHENRSTIQLWFYKIFSQVKPLRLHIQPGIRDKIMETLQPELFLFR